MKISPQLEEELKKQGRQEMARKGGLATLKKYGSDHMRKIRVKRDQEKT